MVSGVTGCYTGTFSCFVAFSMIGAASRCLVDETRHVYVQIRETFFLFFLNVRKQFVTVKIAGDLLVIK